MKILILLIPVDHTMAEVRVFESRAKAQKAFAKLRASRKQYASIQEYEIGVKQRRRKAMK